MNKITKRNTELKAGTIIEHNACCVIELTSDYDGESYNCIELEYDDEINDFKKIEGTEGVVTPSDLIGDYIY